MKNNNLAREEMRHRISSILFSHGSIEGNYPHTEWNPMDFNHPLSFPSIIGIFETQDGILYFNPCDDGMPIEFDDMSTEDLAEILRILEEDNT